MKHILIITLSILFTHTAFAQTINVKDSKVEFEIMNRGKIVKGSIQNVKGEVNFDASKLDASNFSATVDPSTINTKSSGRDSHLQKDDFFGVASFPLIKMESKSIAKTKNGYEAKATLTIRDISMEVSIPFTVTTKGSKQTLEGQLSVNRTDYKLGEGTNEASIGFDVSVNITCVVDLK